MADAQDENQPQRWSRRHIAYHEAAHAVIAWNFGFDVLRVVVNVEERSGYMLPFGTRSREPEAIGNILSTLAGGLAHRCYASPIDKQEVLCSRGDFNSALKQVHQFTKLPLSTAMPLLINLLKYTRTLLDRPEIKLQVQTVAEAVLIKGVLTKWQLQKILGSLPASRAAQKQCQAMKQQIEADWDTIVAKATVDAERVETMPEYVEALAQVQGSQKKNHEE